MASQNLFIGSLAYATTDDTMKAFFETIGEVTSARVVMDRESGRSKGFGFVFSSENAQCQGKDIKNITVYKARSLAMGDNNNFESIYKTMSATYIERILRYDIQPLNFH